MVKTAESLLEEYEINKKLRTIRNWKKSYDLVIPFEEFKHFKENKLIYLKIKELENMKKNLNPYILSQLI